SETSSIATVVDSHSMVTLPLNGRTLDRLILISAGNTSDSPSNPKLADSVHWGGNVYTIDGGACNDLATGGAAYAYQTQLSTTTCGSAPPPRRFSRWERRLCGTAISPDSRPFAIRSPMTTLPTTASPPTAWTADPSSCWSSCRFPTCPVAGRREPG